jgi:hypothetical protein
MNNEELSVLDMKLPMSQREIASFFKCQISDIAQ